MELTLKQKARFERKFSKVPTGCWVWKGTISSNGYGQFKVNKFGFQAHRISYELAKGPIETGLQLDHLCRNRACINPEHLEPVSIKENVLRGVGITAQQAKRTQCPRGHFYDQENTRIYKRNNGSPFRICITCSRQRYHLKRLNKEPEAANQPAHAR